MFGLYIHIPYCLQRCSYCDFATYVHDQILPAEAYVELLKKELRLKSDLLPTQPLTSIYFGGGTPSLLSSDLILSLLSAIEKSKLQWNADTEVTLEINPATLDTEKIRHLLRGGVNRFSVGAQTFHDHLLKAAGRKHSAEDTRKTLDLLQQEGVNYSFDLLFALPKQSMEELEADLDEIEKWSPPHLSAYCLTVPTGHPMSYNRPSEEKQVEMFQRIFGRLKNLGLERYEISNFAKPGHESKHNLLYWQDGEYLGLGLSAHSYLKHPAPWGTRFWNPSGIQDYEKLIQTEKFSLDLWSEKKLSEQLSEDESLFDFCHTSLRLERGLLKHQVAEKFSPELYKKLQKRLETLCQKDLIQESPDRWSLTEDGLLISNYVFSQLDLDGISG